MEASEKIPWMDVRYMVGGHFKLESEIFHSCPWTKIQFFYLLVLGSRQTSNFCQQYCDKTIYRYCHKKTFFYSLCESLVISADFEKQKQYFDQKNIALSIYCNIALSFYHNISYENRSSDEGLRGPFLKGVNPMASSIFS